MNDSATPEPDRAGEAPHPRMTNRLYGQEAAEAEVLEAYRLNRVHHSWLITGPRGVGKATLAWRIARFLLAEETGSGLFGVPAEPTTLDVPVDHPVVRRTRSLSEGRLLLVRRTWDEKTKRIRGEITVDETRRLGGFFGLSATDGGRRVVIIDAADEMNANAANAVLKLLEEPPARATILLVCHRPARILPTIRSRCRELRAAGLGEADLEAAMRQAIGEEKAFSPGLLALADGSVGRALALATEDGPALYGEISALFANAPELDRGLALRLSDAAGARGAEGRRALMLDLVDTYLARLACTGAGRPPAREVVTGELGTLHRLAPDASAARAWATLQQGLSERTGRGLAVNLDAQSLFLDMILKINDTAAAIVSRH